ncbi:hypothetical protein K7472_19675 [Streptomyces sp. PTM05]|uniref:Uncharacterized protein n=1 Tax=Streptantibioticus parmotrematis TaxID=2873249 RepID=A0ABS7QV08_9ACTN|nr:hypothetical protein [Streptantibioticus parmotrematis]MBY8887050.1 hypothetical protein [Streptantibioticus parmotrematis]
MTWPPVLVHTGSRIFVDGVPSQQIGVVRSWDGDLQLMIRGWPVFGFSKGTAAGQTNGEGVVGAWFAVFTLSSRVLPATVTGSSPTPFSSKPD